MKSHHYSPGYGRDVLLSDNPGLESHYHHHYTENQPVNNWVTTSPGVHGYNGSLSQNSQSSLGHIYESPDFVNSIIRDTGPGDVC